MPTGDDDRFDEETDVDSDETPSSPRLKEVDGKQGMPGELVGGEHNQPGSQEPPPGAEPSDTPISDAKGTT